MKLGTKVVAVGAREAGFEGLRAKHTEESGAPRADFAQGVHRFETIESAKHPVSDVSGPGKTSHGSRPRASNDVEIFMAAGLSLNDYRGLPEENNTCVHWVLPRGLARRIQGSTAVAALIEYGAWRIFRDFASESGRGGRSLLLSPRFKSRLIVLAFATLSCTAPCWGQNPAPATPSAGGDVASDRGLSGSISGKVVDQTGAMVSGARVRLTLEERNSTGQAAESRASKNQNHPEVHEILSNGDGQFLFSSVAPGPFQLTISAAGFGAQTFSGILHSGEADVVPTIALNVAEAVTEVRVGLGHAELVELAEEEIKVEEHQRVLGAIPNFYVSYIPDAVPLTSGQKFKLAWKTVIDPFTFVVVAGAAGVEQAQNHFAGYGQGTEGYAKRFGAGYADTIAGTFIGSAILPSILKQDPRYFYKGTGSIPSRFMYAIANSVICKGDNRHWQVNYSNILGSLAAGGISNIYYPAQDRDGATLTVENGAIGIGATAIQNLFQEFVVKKLTPKIPKSDPKQNSSTLNPSTN